MKRIVPALMILILLCLTGCGEKAEKPDTGSPEAAAVPAPSQTADLYDTVTELTLPTDAGEAEIRDILNYRHLTFVDASACTEYALLSEVQRQLPEVEMLWQLELCGRELTSAEEELDFSGAGLTDNGELLEKLDYLPRLDKVTLLDSGLSDEQCRQLADKYPEIDFLWMLKVGEWTLRTDITCFSTLRDCVLYRYTNDDLEPLFKYCKHLRALDLGHNDLTDLEPLTNLKELQVLIIADNSKIKDVSPLSKLAELEYLECFMIYDATGFETFSELKNMKMLCVSYCHCMDSLDYIAEMPELEMMWAVNTALTQKQWEDYEEKYPDIKFRFVFYAYPSSIPGEWRAVDMNVEVRTAFRNWRYVKEFRAWDDVEYEPDSPWIHLAPDYAAT